MSVIVGIVGYVVLLIVVVALVGGNRSDDEMHERVVQRMRSGFIPPEEPSEEPAEDADLEPLVASASQRR